MARAKKAAFSKVQAAKARSRAVVGAPPPERVLPDPKAKRLAAPRYKETLADLLHPQNRLQAPRPSTSKPSIGDPR